MSKKFSYDFANKFLQWLHSQGASVFNWHGRDLVHLDRKGFDYNITFKYFADYVLIEISRK